MSKQVLKTSTVAAEAVVEANQSQKPNNLYVSVKTYDVDGRPAGERVVDMYHFGTDKWLRSHNWWAMHNDHTVETMRATTDEVAAYLAQAKQALADKFNGTSAPQNAEVKAA
jgi:hypothetical protein